MITEKVEREIVFGFNLESMPSCCGMQVWHNFTYSTSSSLQTAEQRARHQSESGRGYCTSSELVDFLYGLDRITLFTVSSEQYSLVEFIMKVFKRAKLQKRLHLVQEFINNNTGNAVWLYMYIPANVSTNLGDVDECKEEEVNEVKELLL